MADEIKRKDIDSTTEDLAEAISFLYNLYKSIISKRLNRVNRKLRKVKVYPALSLPSYQRRVKVYEPLTIPDEQETVQVLTLPDNYYPTSQTEVKHVLNHERYNNIYNTIANQLKREIKNNGRYVELNNFEELFAALERSAITELYEKYFTLDDMEMVVAIYGEVMALSEVITHEYRIRKAFNIWTDI